MFLDLRVGACAQLRTGSNYKGGLVFSVRCALIIDIPQRSTNPAPPPRCRLLKVHVWAACVGCAGPRARLVSVPGRGGVSCSEAKLGGAGSTLWAPLGLRWRQALTTNNNHTHTHSSCCCSLNVNKLAADAKRSRYRRWISLHGSLAADRTPVWSTSLPLRHVCSLPRFFF